MKCPASAFLCAFKNIGKVSSCSQGVFRLSWSTPGSTIRSSNCNVKKKSQIQVLALGALAIINKYNKYLHSHTLFLYPTGLQTNQSHASPLVQEDEVWGGLSNATHSPGWWQCQQMALGALHSFRALANTDLAEQMQCPDHQNQRELRWTGFGSKAMSLLHLKCHITWRYGRCGSWEKPQQAHTRPFNFLEYETWFPHCVLTVCCFGRHWKGQWKFKGT